MQQAAQEQSLSFDRVARLLLTVVVIIGLLALMRHLSDVLVPFAAAAVLAYLLNPIVTLIEKRIERRWVAVGITLAGLGLLGILLMSVLVPLMFSQLGRFERTLSGLRADLPETLAVPVARTRPAAGGEIASTGGATASAAATTQAAEVEKSALGWRELLDGLDEYRHTQGEDSRKVRLTRLYDRVDGTQVGVLVHHAAAFVKTEQFRELLLNALKQLAVGGVTVVNFAVNLVLGATVLIVVLIYLVFLLLDFNEYVRSARELLPPKYREGIVEFFSEFETAMHRYFRGQFVVALSVGILFSIGFTIIGLPMAVPFGLFVGLLNMVPYLQIVAILPAVILALLGSIESSASPLGAIGLVLLVFAVVQVSQDAFIVPRVMGKATGLRPVSILLGVFVWGKLLGFFGLILAIPLTCLGIAYYHRHLLTSSLAKDDSLIRS